MYAARMRRIRETIKTDNIIVCIWRILYTYDVSIYTGAESETEDAHYPRDSAGRLRQLIFYEFAPPTRSSHLLRSAPCETNRAGTAIADCAATAATAADVDRYLCDRVLKATKTTRNRLGYNALCAHRTEHQAADSRHVLYYIDRTERKHPIFVLYPITIEPTPVIIHFHKNKNMLSAKYYTKTT